MAGRVVVSEGTFLNESTGTSLGIGVSSVGVKGFDMAPQNPGALQVNVGMTLGSGQTITVNNLAYFIGFAFSPTLVYDNSLFSGGRTFQDSATYKNTPGQAKIQLHHTGFYAAPTVRGDGALFTTDRTAFLDAPDYGILNAGTVAATTKSFQSACTVGAGVTVTSRRGFEYNDASGAGTVDLQIGADISALAKATTNIGIRNAATTVDTPSVATITAAGNTIAADATVKRLDNTTGGSITLTSTPTIADGQDGQILVLFTSSAQSVVLTHGAANNLRLDGGTNKTLATRASITLMFSSTIGDWIQIQPVVTPT